MIESLSQGARAGLLGVVAATAAFLVFGGAQGRGTSDPFDAVPRDAYLVAQLNVAEARRSPLYDVVFGREGHETGRPRAQGLIDTKALGMGKLADACGFDPLGRVDALALAVPEEGERGELGVAARINVTSDELTACASALADKRGAKVETRAVGSFVVLEQGGEAAVPARIAFGKKSLLVVARGAWFDAMLAAADRKQPGVREAAAHSAMRASLTSHPGWHAPTLVVTALLPRGLRDRLKNEMASELDGKDGSHGMMAGVLGVGAAGLALRAGGHGEQTEAAIELACDTDEGQAAGTGEEACAAVEKLIQKQRLAWSKELMLRMVGLGPLLDSIEIKREGRRLRVTAGAPADTLATILDRVLRLRASRGERTGPPTRETQPRPPPSAEVVPAPRP